MRNMLGRGLQKGLQTTWELSKIILPITIVVTLLKHTPVIEWIVVLFSPLMNLFGLPGEAAVVLALGWTLNLYAAIGAIFSLQLSVPEIFILSVMLSFCHNLLVETAVAKRIGLNAAVVVAIRVGSAFISGVLLHLTMGNEVQSVSGSYTHNAYLWQMPISGTVQEVFFTAFKAIGQLALIVIPLMAIIQVLKEKQVLDKVSHKMYPFLRWLGMSEKAAIPMLAGIWFGLAFGAGVIIEATRETPLPKRELYLIMIFLVLCHAVVEDTLLFLPLGINGWYLLGIRLLSAIILTIIVARIWRATNSNTQLPTTSNMS